MIVPKTLIRNWEQEIKRFTPALSYHLHAGGKKERRASNFSNADLVITNYHLALNDSDLLKSAAWSCLILDEAQTIKNPQAKMTRMIKKFKAGFKLALTGTPIENRPLDLWSQFDFLMPGYLGGVRSFRKRYENGGQKALAELKKLTAPFVLRRKKSEVLSDLPEKTEIVRYCEFSPDQRKLYDDIRLGNQRKIEALENNASREIHLLTMLLRLRQIACHPNLIYKNDNDHAQSGKLNTVVAMAEEIISENHKILVFSQFVEHLELMKKALDQRHINTFFLHGATQNRQQVICRFKKSHAPSVFLISLKAGGLGLNLTEASYVFLLDPWWNPAVENQAIDRSYRMGQKTNVTVIRFITEGSIEEKVKQLQQTKKTMADKIIADTDLNQSPFSHDELIGLLKD